MLNMLLTPSWELQLCRRQLLRMSCPAEPLLGLLPIENMEPFEACDFCDLAVIIEDIFVDVEGIGRT